MKTCSLCTHWLSIQGLFAFCNPQDGNKKFSDSCISWQATREPRTVCEYCGRPNNSPNYANHICSPLIEKAIWMRSGAQGRILHLIDPSGLAKCGRQFDPQKTQAPKVISTAPTMPYCHSCMQAVLVQQTKGVQNA